MAVDGEVRAIHSAQVAAAALFRVHDMGRVIALGIEGGRERQDLGGTELHAKAARLTALHNNINSTFCHENPHVRKWLGTSKESETLWGSEVAARCDDHHGWM